MLKKRFEKGEEMPRNRRKVFTLDEATLAELKRASDLTGISESRIAGFAIAFFIGNPSESLTRGERAERNRQINISRERIQAALRKDRPG